MSQQISLDPNGEIIDVGRIKPRRRRWRWFILVAIVLLFFLLTLLILRVGFWLIERAFAQFAFGPRTIFVSQQPVNISPGRLLRPIAWIVSVLAGLVFGLG